MIKLIDPQRQAELEEIIVQLGANVGSLTENMEYLRDNNRQLVHEIRGVQQTCRRLEGKVQELERLGRKMDISDTRVGASDYPWDTVLFTRTALDRIKYDMYDSPSMNYTSIPDAAELTRVNMVSTPTSSSSTFGEFCEDYVQRAPVRVTRPYDEATRSISEELTRISPPIGPSDIFRNSERGTCE